MPGRQIATRKTAKDEHELDLALAAQLQAALLPKACPVDCVHQAAAARNRMCSTIGGDFHDFLRVNEDQVAILVGDVVGHGVRASLLMAQIMGFLRSLARDRLSRPTPVISDLNAMLIDLGERTGSVLSCSLFFAVIDAPTGVTFFVNAGHPRPLLFDRKQCQALPLGTKNMVLGVEPFAPEEDCITFTPGQRMVLYTDGVTDAANASGARFGEARLVEAINSHSDDGPDSCADAIFDAVAAFRGTRPQVDDETVVVIDRLDK
ncbi:MAG: PP2C family protein-serine/threonine phosphatase [Phycisphaerae bacterium]